MTAANSSEEDGPELAVDMDTPETVLMNHSNFQLVQRAIKICRCITAWDSSL